jgi:hypothetical protein
MSWSESEKLNEWIFRAYENGRREEQERIIELLENDYKSQNGIIWSQQHVIDLIALIKGHPAECECDPCGDETCTCQGKRCDFCKAKDV